MKLFMILLVLVLALVTGAAVALNHFFGWKGLLALPVFLIVLLWLGKILVGRLIKRFALGLFAMKAKALHKAAITVHSIVPVAEPPKDLAEETNKTASEDEADADPDADDEPDAAGEPDEPEEPKHYYAVDLTVTPVGGNGESVWEPTELILTSEQISSLGDLEDGDKEVGRVHEVLVWDGSAFGPDDPGKYPGTQRLKVTFAVKPGTSRAWVHYYNEGIGKLDFPAWKIQG